MYPTLTKVSNFKKTMKPLREFTLTGKTVYTNDLGYTFITSVCSADQISLYLSIQVKRNIWILQEYFLLLSRSMHLTEI